VGIFESQLSKPTAKPIVRVPLGQIIVRAKLPSQRRLLVQHHKQNHGRQGRKRPRNRG
jgi:hypothetical protein